MIIDILGWTVIFVLWLLAPPIIAKEKGRRWWLWLLISLFWPFGGYILVLMIYPARKKGEMSIC